MNHVVLDAHVRALPAGLFAHLQAQAQTCAPFADAVVALEALGLNQRQLQWLMGKPFSRFMPDDRCAVLLLHWLLATGRTAVTEWYERLHEERLDELIYGLPRTFYPETLPSRALIALELGIPGAPGDALTSPLPTTCLGWPGEATNEGCPHATVQTS